MTNLIRVIPNRSFSDAKADPHMLQEWLVTNGLGGYASGTVTGAITRRYHGLLIAALPNPLGRMMMLNGLSERLRLPDGRVMYIGAEQLTGISPEAILAVSGFRLEAGLPVWRYEVDGFVLEKRLFLPYRQNSVHLTYLLLSGHGKVRLGLRPAMHFRSHDAHVSERRSTHYKLSALEDQFEITGAEGLPALRLMVHGPATAFTFDRKESTLIPYRTERDRGYEWEGSLWSPGYFRADLCEGDRTTLVASTEEWDAICALAPEGAFRAELDRRKRLLDVAPPQARTGPAAELVLAADQFLITPVGRAEDVTRMRASGDEIRTVIAGYPWFTDWGRDTMISLEGLTLMTGRQDEAGWILRTFANYVRDGLIPNMFPEGARQGLYHTADASLWFFHAMHRYLRMTNDRSTLKLVLPKLLDIIEHHRNGTLFGIGMDPKDALLHQGQQGYQLTWMDAKVGDWVVTPRRGKAVEINALWYNALRLMAVWLEEEGDEANLQRMSDTAQRVRDSFNQRFWCEEGGYLYDVVDGEDGGSDDACRPNQIFAISLDYPVLDEVRWKQVMDVVTNRLLTPVGLRSLSPGHPDYKAKYYGDLRARDAAYHQGTVWAWLIGPYVDAWLKLNPGKEAQGRQFLTGLAAHLDEACIGSVSEVFDAEEPYTPRGCVAQAWSIAELLRCWVTTANNGMAHTCVKGLKTKCQDGERIKAMDSNSGQTVSIWMATAEEPQIAPLSENMDADVCVVGAGIAGMTTAYLLTRAGKEVIVLDDGRIGGGMTERTTAHLSNAIDDRYFEIEHLHGEKGAMLAAESHTAAIDRIEAIVAEEGIDCDFERLVGYLFVPPDDSKDLLERELKAAHRAGLTNVEQVGRAPIAGFDTGMSLRFPRQAQFHPLKYLAGLKRAIERGGGRIFTGTHAGKIEGGVNARVETSSGFAVTADAIVIATNTPINDIVTIHTKQASYTTYVIGARIPRGSVTRALYWDTADPYHYVRVQSVSGKDGNEYDLLLVGGEDHKSGQADDGDQRYAHLEAWARERFPMIERIEMRWSGQVMEPVDGLAFIGRNPGDQQNVYIITGDSGMGMTHGTIGGILVTELILGVECPWESLYAPSRITLRASLQYARENINVAAQYVEGYLSGGDVDSPEKIAPGEGAIVRRGIGKVAVYRDEDGTLHERSAVCPHLGGIVAWNHSEKTWDCPCHGSRFDCYGRVITGPANRDLEGAKEE